MASVPDIQAITYDVCGVARTVSSAYTAKVLPIWFSALMTHVSYTDSFFLKIEDALESLFG